MTVRLIQQQTRGNVYFITFTCYHWKPLIELTQAYDAVYKWFDYLKSKKSSLIGYVIMPNHLHVLVYLSSLFKSISSVVSNAKRFIAYEIIQRLETKHEWVILDELHHAVKPGEAKKGQIHKVFEDSFDCKECYSEHFIRQKLSYMHENPIKGKWKLSEDFALYSHSSAGFYFGTNVNAYKNILRVEDLTGE